MASKALSKMALLLSLNLFFFTLVSSHYVPCPPPPKSSKPPPIKPPTSPSPPKSPKTPPIKPPISPSPPKSPKSPPIKPPTPSPPKKPYCPNDALKLGVCANLLNDLVNVIVGTPAKTPCCSLLGGLADLDAAVCLCTAIKANVLGINLNVPVSLSLLLNYCGKSVPSDYTCDA